MSSVTYTSWQLPAINLSLEQGVVHLWRFPLTDSPAEDILDSFEKLRLERLRIPEKARAFVVARTRLRQIVARYLAVAPQNITFAYGENGKPFLKDNPVCFNMSHSGDWGLCALSKNADIGVDLEEINTGLNFSSLAQRFFSTDENAWLSSIPENRQRRSFYRLWTRKEAWLKAKGGGFSELSLGLTQDHVCANAIKADGWWMMNFPAAKGYVGAVAVAVEVERVERWRWE